MTTRPRLHTSSTQVVGLVAFVLFGVLAAVFLTADFGSHATFEGATGITASIGYAMFNLDAGSLPSEGFLIAFEIIDVVLLGALAAAVMLGKRDDEEESDESVTMADGGDR
jgi:NADH-quinone oxidoreductase subunit J